MASRDWVLFDRDGTLIVEKEYLCDPEGVELLPGVVSGLQRLKGAGFFCTVFSNQSGIGRGMFRREDVDAVNLRMCELLDKRGITLDGVYYCPHRPEDGCQCRKPGIALIHQASLELGLGMERLVAMVGDKALDLETGKRLGIPSVLVMTGYGRKEFSRGCRGDACCENLDEAAQWILKVCQGVGS